MKKNVASQVIGVQMVSANDGSAFTGSVTAYVTGDGGTQAAGSVGAGACTHEGNGFYTYAPAQAETNYDHVAFTFVGTGAVPATVQAYPTFPQTGDAFARLGAPAGASVSADVAAVKAETASILTDTAEIGAAGAGLTALASASALAVVDGIVDSILVDTAVIGAAGAGLSAIPWNAAWDAEVQSEAADALTAYGAATSTDVSTAAANVSVDEIQATALADLFNTNSTTTYASAVAGSVVKEIADNAGGAALTAGAVADAVWDEALAGHATAGSAGEALAAAGTAGDPWTTPLPGAYGAGTAGKIIGDNINAAVSSRASQSSVDVVDGIVDAILVDTAEIGASGAGLTALASAAALATVDTVVDAIKVKTDSLPPSPAASGEIPTATQNADALLNRDMAAVSDTNARSPLNALRFLRNKWSIAGATLTVTKEDDTAAAWNSTVSTSPGADPVVGNDPA